MRISRTFPLLPCLLAVSMLVASNSADAARRDQETVSGQGAATTPPPSSVGNTVDELRRLMSADQLTELRTTYNGHYGASLLFNADNLTYYVALFEDKDFWRVIRTDSVDQAEAVYKTFVEQTRDLAQVYIDTVRLEAGKRYTEKLVAMNEQRLQGLQQAVAQQRQKSMEVSAQIRQTQQQAVSLSSDLRATNSQLDALKERIQALQAAQEDPQLSLPEPPQAAPTAPETTEPVASSPFVN